MNAWQTKATSLSYDSGIWTTTIKLSPGQYAYRLIVNGESILDPVNSSKKSNNMGGYNSLWEIHAPEKSQLPILESLQANDNQFRFGCQSNSTPEIIVLLDNHQISYSYESEEYLVEIPDAYTSKNVRI